MVGLTRLTELYLRSVSEFAPEQVRVAGLLVHSPEHTGGLSTITRCWERRSGRRNSARPQASSVAVNRIVVTTAFDRLPEAERRALLNVEQSSGIRLELIATGAPGSTPLPTLRAGSASSGNAIRWRFRSPTVNWLAWRDAPIGRSSGAWT